MASDKVLGRKDLYRFLLQRLLRRPLVQVTSTIPLEMPGPIIPSPEWHEAKGENSFRQTLDEAEHQQRMEYARIEHERRMELIEAEAAVIDEKARRLALEITPSNTRLEALAGTFKAPEGTFDDEEMPY